MWSSCPFLLLSFRKVLFFIIFILDSRWSNKNRRPGRRSDTYSEKESYGRCYDYDYHHYGRSRSNSYQKEYLYTDGVERYEDQESLKQDVDPSVQDDGLQSQHKSQDNSEDNPIESWQDQLQTSVGGPEILSDNSENKIPEEEALDEETLRDFGKRLAEENTLAPALHFDWAIRLE